MAGIALLHPRGAAPERDRGPDLRVLHDHGGLQTARHVRRSVRDRPPGHDGPRRCRVPKAAPDLRGPPALSPIFRQDAGMPFWPSPISTRDVAGSGVRPAWPTAHGGRVWWTEDRPDEGGRTTIMCRAADGTCRELLPAPWNARTRVHE